MNNKITGQRMYSPIQSYELAQKAMAELKTAVYILLSVSEPDGLRNVDIGKSLGIYKGHVEHEGHIPRTLLGIMEAEGVVEQDEVTKLWTLKPTQRNEEI